MKNLPASRHSHAGGNPPRKVDPRLRGCGKRAALHCLHLLFLLHLFPDATMAAPTNPTTRVSLSTTEPTTPVTKEMQSPLRNSLSGYCNGIVDYGGLNLDDTTIASVVTALKQFRKKYPRDNISQCVIKIPDGSAVDEAIMLFNEGKLLSENYNVAFLLLGKGIRISGDGAVESCHLRPHRFAGDPKAQLSAIQDKWEDSYQIKESISLAAGQKLIGIPLNINSGSLAEGYYVNLRRTITGQIRCKPSSTDFTGFDVDKDNLITLSHSGVVVSGFTNILDINEKATVRGTCTYRRRGRTYSRSHESEVDAYLGYRELIKAEIDPKLVTSEDTHFYDISDNEFFQVKESAIDVAFKTGADTIHSNRMNKMTFVRINNNRLYSCHPQISSKFKAPILNISTYYKDDAQNPELIHALMLVDNHFMTKGKVAVELLSAPNTKTVLKKNDFVTSGQSISDSRGISLTGINHLQDTPGQRPDFKLENNNVTGFQDALLLDGALTLELNSNQLNGNKSAIARVPGQLTDPIKLSGNGGNRYLRKVISPCAGLELSSIEGGFLFSDGTPCPSNYLFTEASP